MREARTVVFGLRSSVFGKRAAACSLRLAARGETGIRFILLGGEGQDAVLNQPQWAISGRGPRAEGLLSSSSRRQLSTVNCQLFLP